MMMSLEEIKKILPHRYPFLLVDRVLELRDLLEMLEMLQLHHRHLLALVQALRVSHVSGRSFF